MTFAFHPEAEDEFIEAAAYYESCEPGLGLDFCREVYTAIQNAIAHPRMWPALEGDVHRCLVHRFPYGIFFSIEPEGIFIVAVMHLRRTPDYWKHRRQPGGKS
ncbi:MAG: type II toxin-antitoxin system RelE/ParE family toxin [Candidatus Sumerlaeota bacterium]|nr:type II toxin-antitoxin system RelE/ParE family toxin [Candidatus Sumerlaeota bacterium]